MSIVNNTRRRLFAVMMMWIFAIPLTAQLDPRLQKSPTDFLDLYQQGGSGAGSVRPEIYSLIDISTSMLQLSFHELFPNNWDNELPSQNFENSRSQHYDVYVRIDSNKNGNYYIKWVGFGRNAAINNYISNDAPSEVIASNTTYLIGGNRIEVQPNSGIYTNTLIKPDGTEVTEADANMPRPANFFNPTARGRTPKEHAVNWVTCASHVRMRCERNGIVRDIDLPINWAVIDMGYTGSTQGPLTPLKVLNPVENGGDGKLYDVCNKYTFANPPGDAYLHEYDRTTAEIGAGRVMQEIGIALYRSRYIEWIFWGIDTTGRYCIPNAVTSQDSRVMNAIDPSSITYDGETDKFYKFRTTRDPKPAFLNKLPNRSRFQAVKEAHVKAWFANQHRVLWAYRPFLAANPTYLKSSDPSTIMSLVNLTSFTGTPLYSEQRRSYRDMMRAEAFYDMEKELGYGLAQLECQKHFLLICTDGAPQDMSATYERDKSNYPYLYNGTSGTLAASGNNVIKNAVNGTGKNIASMRNLATYSGIAAHGGSEKGADGSASTWILDPSTPISSGNDSLDGIPYWIKGRGGFVYKQPHYIQTMTMGVSLGVRYLDTLGNAINPDVAPNPIEATGEPALVPLNAVVNPIHKDTEAAKFRLLMGALTGDPSVLNPDPENVRPYYRKRNPDNTIQAKKAPNATYYFDGRDPKTLVDNLLDAMDEIRNISQINTSTAPVIPFVGVGLGEQVYMTRFVPGETNSPIWTGDLMMFPTRMIDGKLTLMDGNGNVLRYLEKDTPGWSVNDTLISKSWSKRTVYTRLPQSNGLKRLTSLGSDFNAIKVSVAKNSATDAAKQKVISWLLGANTTDSGYLMGDGQPNPNCPNRTKWGDILGDVINSTPVSVEYTLDEDGKLQGQDLPAELSTLVSVAKSSGTKCNFRVIFVGTNRGMLHAFGEVSYRAQSSPGGESGIMKGAVAELWAFVPTEFLENIDYMSSGSGKHYYGVDGTPYVHFYDIPGRGAILGNNKIDKGEDAVVVFGLRKGGRGYYAIDIRNPFAPFMGDLVGSDQKLGWSLVPDEFLAMSQKDLEAKRDDDAISSGDNIKKVVSDMGFSTCIPAVGRVVLGKTDKKIRDILFLGGGHSLPLQDLSGSITEPGLNWPKLGRSVIAMDVMSGKLVAVWDMSSENVGPISAGIVPFQFFPNSGLVQRAYFTDYKGGLWALGSGYQNTSGDYKGFRRDSSVLNNWSADGSEVDTLYVRKVYQDAGAAWNTTSSNNNAIYSTRPAPFNIGNFPGSIKWSGGGDKVMVAHPATVGIAMVSGDRDDPLDRRSAGNNNLVPNQHRITVVFDRQKVMTNAITDANLSDLTSKTNRPSPDWLEDKNGNPTLGYYYKFPARQSNFTSKGIYEPIVINNVLFYSYFTPMTASCTGGTGETNTVRICDVLFPSWPGLNVNAAEGAGCQSGRIAGWIGVASPLGILNTSTALQAGVQEVSTPDGLIPTIRVSSYTGDPSDRHPKIRSWRTVR